MLSDEEDNLIDFLEAKYGCHTVILYGSRARGTAHETSDWDVLGLIPTAQRRWHNGWVEGIGDVNAYLYPTPMAQFKPESPSPLFSPANYFVRLRHGRVLVQEDGLGDAIVAKARQVYQVGPPAPLKESMAQRRHYFLDYGIGSLRNDALPAATRSMIRSEILFQASTAYFYVRRMWPPSPRETFEYLKLADSKGAALFEAAYEPAASIASIEALMHHILDVGELA